MATRRVVPIACGVNCPWAGQYHRSINSRCGSVARLLKPNTCTLYIIFHIALTHVCRPFAASPERIVEKPDNFAINVHCPRPRFKPVIDLVQRVVHHLHLQVPHTIAGSQIRGAQVSVRPFLRRKAGGQGTGLKIRVLCLTIATKSHRGDPCRHMCGVAEAQELSEAAVE